MNRTVLDLWVGVFVAIGHAPATELFKGKLDMKPVRKVHDREFLDFLENAWPEWTAAGYRGEIKVCLINLDPDQPIRISRGDRIAQLIVQRVELPDLVEVASFEEAGIADTSRGSGGHGSSGGHASL